MEYRNVISSPVQTQRALLTWQTPLGAGGGRDRYAVGELIVNADGTQFQYLKGTASFQTALDEGFLGYPGLPLDAECPHADALEIFLRRLPSSERSDYNRFLETFGLSPSAEWTGLSLLSYTGARLAGDSFGFTETFDGFDQPFRFIFDVAGFRHYRSAADDLEPGDVVRLEHEPANESDSNAVQILREDGEPLGYINRLQCERVLNWVRLGAIEARVFRFNGRPVYPRLFLIADISPRVMSRAA